MLHQILARRICAHKKQTKRKRWGGVILGTPDLLSATRTNNIDARQREQRTNKGHTMVTIYGDIEDYKQDVIYPSLGELGVLYDIDAIAEDMLVWSEVIDERTGLVDSNRTGFVERDDVNFWDVVARHDVALRSKM